MKKIFFAAITVLLSLTSATAQQPGAAALGLTDLYDDVTDSVSAQIFQSLDSLSHAMRSGHYSRLEAQRVEMNHRMDQLIKIVSASPDIDSSAGFKQSLIKYIAFYQGGLSRVLLHYENYTHPFIFQQIDSVSQYMFDENQKSAVLSGLRDSREEYVKRNGLDRPDPADEIPVGLISLDSGSMFIEASKIPILFPIACHRAANGEQVDAANLFTVILNADSTYEPAYVQRGLCEAALYAYDDAFDDFNHAIRLDPKDTVAYFQRGMVNEYRRRYKDAVSDYSMAITLDPRNGVIYFARADTELSLKQNTEACNDFNKAKELGNKDADEMIKKYCK